jgi:hypothetical protein
VKDVEAVVESKYLRKDSPHFHDESQQRSEDKHLENSWLKVFHSNTCFHQQFLLINRLIYDPVDISLGNVFRSKLNENTNKFADFKEIEGCHRRELTGGAAYGIPWNR